LIAEQKPAQTRRKLSRERFGRPRC
jgi:hypothetical protein